MGKRNERGREEVRRKNELQKEMKIGTNEWRKREKEGRGDK